MRWGGGNYALTFNNNKVVSPTDQLARFDPAVQQLVPLQLHAAIAAGFRIDQTRQQMQAAIINRGPPS